MATTSITSSMTMVTDEREKQSSTDSSATMQLAMWK